MMDLNATRMFISVAQIGSLSAAAQRLGLPLPTLSRRIRELEQQLKVQLLERSARGTRLTDAGTRLYEHASAGIEALAEAERAVKDDQTSLRGHLRLSLPTGFEPWWDLLGAFQRRHPGIQLNVYSTDRRIEHVQDGIDVALRIGDVVHETMIARRLLSYRHILVASPSLLQRLGYPGSPDDLHRFPCATWVRDANTRGRWHLGDQTIELDARLSTNDYLQLRDRALADEVVTEVPPFLAMEALQDGRLQALLPEFPLPAQQVNLLYPRHRNPSSIVRAYLDYCRQHAAEFLKLPPRPSSQ